MKRLSLVFIFVVNLLLFSCESHFKTLSGTSWVSVTEYRKINLDFTSDNNFTISYLYQNESDNFSTNGTYVYDNPKVSITYEYDFSGNGQIEDNEKKKLDGKIDGSAMFFTDNNERIMFLIVE